MTYWSWLNQNLDFEYDYFSQSILIVYQTQRILLADEKKTKRNSMSNHLDHVIHTSQFLYLSELSPVVCMIKTRQSWKFKLVTPSSFQNIAFLRFHVCHKRSRNRNIRKWFFVNRMTSRLARTLKIGTGNASCTMNAKVTFKTSKNQPFLSYCTCLPKFGCGTTKPQKSMWHYWKFFFCLFYTAWTFSYPKMKSCSFSISSQFNFTNRHCFQTFKGAKWKF